MNNNTDYSHIANLISYKQLQMIKQLLKTISCNNPAKESLEYKRALKLLQQADQYKNNHEPVRDAFRIVFGEDNLKYFEFIVSNKHFKHYPNIMNQISQIFTTKVQSDKS